MTAFEGFTSHSYYDFRVLIVRSAIILVAVALRFLCKLSRTERRLGWDDFWILMALCFNYAGEGLAFWGLFASHGGTATATLIKSGDRKGAEIYLMTADIGTVLWFLSITCLCFSIINFYLRIFRIEDRFERNARIMLGFSGAWGVTSCLASIMNCMPPSNFWKMRDLDKCGNYNVFILCSAIFEIIITAGILVLPIRPVMRLSISRQTRISIAGIFLLGTFVLVSGILRAALVYQPGKTSPNFFTLKFWSGVHITAAFVSACLPMYRPVWTKVSIASKMALSYSQGLITHRLRSSRSRSTMKSDKESERKSTGDEEDAIAMRSKDNATEMIQEYDTWEGKHRK